MSKRLLVFDSDDEAKRRQYVISFYDQYGEKASKKAFGVDRKLIYVWRKRLEVSHGKLTSLLPTSTRPKQLREMKTNPQIIEFIRELRMKHPRLGKEKIKPLLDRYCVEGQIECISESTIGKVISRHHLFFQKSGKVYHNPNSKHAHRTKKVRLRTKRARKPIDFGHIQSDVVEILEHNVKRYLFSAIDIRMKFALTVLYERNTSENNTDFYEKFKSVYPTTIQTWQTDNGSENLGLFEIHLEKEGIPHFFTYPRCPKINGCIERYNRTIQEEFVYCCDILPNDPGFQHALGEYLLFYNTLRVHKSLGLKTPLDFFLSSGGMSNMLVTYTLYRHICLKVVYFPYLGVSREKL